MKISFNKEFGISDRKANTLGYFNQLLVKDTKLFIDPFLLMEKQNLIKEFKGSYSIVIKFFQTAFELAAQTISDDNTSHLRIKLRNMLKFPEDNGFKLGYSNSIYGSGGGSSLTNSLMSQIESTLQRSSEIPQHFEQIALFVVLGVIQ